MSAAKNKSRLGFLDSLRGLCVVSMILYHAMYDLVYMAGISAPWFLDAPGYIWQQSVCWTFILLSGFCWSLSRAPKKHGLVLLGCGALVTLVTWLFMPEELIQYGVLTLLGLSALLLIPLNRLFSRMNVSPAWGLAFSLVLFFFLRDLPRGALGFEGLRLMELPPWLYASDLTAVLGFSSPAFFSTDYFPLLPWFFLYLSGAFLWKLLFPKETSPQGLSPRGAGFLSLEFRPLSFLGRHSLLIYLLHQPVLVGIIQLTRLF